MKSTKPTKSSVLSYTVVDLHQERSNPPLPALKY